MTEIKSKLDHSAIADPSISYKAAPITDLQIKENPGEVKNNLEDLHKENTNTENIADEENHSFKTVFSLDKLLNDVAFRNNCLSGANAVLHSLATVTNYLAKNNPGFKLINHVMDKSAFFCTRWLTPYISYGHAAWTAATKQKEPLLSIIKLIPPAFFPIVGDANIDMVYGTSTAFNQPYDNVINRIKSRIEESTDFAQEVKEARKSPMAFAKMVLNEFKDFVGDFFKGKSDFWKEGIFVVNCSMMLIGSLPMLLFGRDQRDTSFARFSGWMRNIGGTLGDIGWVLGGKVEKEKVMMGIVYTIAQAADIAKRYVGEDAARVLIHLSAALNVSAMTVWNTLNTKNNKKTLDQIVDEKIERSKPEKPEELEQVNLKTEDSLNESTHEVNQNIAA